jgi:hypothetical protein
LNFEFETHLAFQGGSKPKTVIRNENYGQTLKLDEFYEIMGEFYSGVPRHKSPTKRLIEQKHAAFRHKEKLSKVMHRTQEYNQTYIVDPKRSFVIEPKGGEINYSLAFKDPLKFYDNVIKQDIVEHKISQKRLGN